MQNVGWFENKNCVIHPFANKNPEKFTPEPSPRFCVLDENIYEIKGLWTENERSWIQIAKCIAAIVFSIILCALPLLYPPIRNCIFNGGKEEKISFLVERVAKNSLSEDQIKKLIEEGHLNLIEDSDVNLLISLMQEHPEYLQKFLDHSYPLDGSQSNFKLLIDICLSDSNFIRPIVKHLRSNPRLSISEFLITLVSPVEGFPSAEKIDEYFPLLKDLDEHSENERVNIFNHRGIMFALAQDCGKAVEPYLDPSIAQDPWIAQWITQA